MVEKGPRITKAEKVAMTEAATTVEVATTAEVAMAVEISDRGGPTTWTLLRTSELLPSRFLCVHLLSETCHLDCYGTKVVVVVCSSVRTLLNQEIDSPEMGHPISPDEMRIHPGGDDTTLTISFR